MKIVNRLNLDSPPINSEHGSWRNAQHIQIAKDGSCSENEDGLVEELRVPTSYSYLGKIVIPSDVVLFYYNNDRSSLVLFLKSAYGKAEIEIIDSRYKDKKIHGTYTYNHKNELIITFGTTSNSEDSPELLILNMTDTANQSITLNSKEYERILLSPNYFTTIPQIDLPSVSTGGTLESGVYFISLCYEDEYGNLSPFTSISRPIVISTFDIDSPKNKIKPSGHPTNKAINLKISNLSSNYKYLRFAVLLYKEETLATIKLTSKINYNNNVLDYTISNINTLMGSSLEQILINNAVYTRAVSSTYNANRLLLSGVRTESNHFEEFQKVANNIQIVPNVSVKFNSTDRFDSSPNVINSFADTKSLYYNQPFKKGEYYNFYIGWKSKKGGYLCVNHIPGTFATDNVYPESMGSLAGRRIKIHKMPDFSEIEDLGTSRVVLGIDVLNVNIPTSLKEICGGWEIFYSERTNSNITILGQGFVPAHPSLTATETDLKSRDRNRLIHFELFYTKYPSINISKLKHVAEFRPRYQYSQGSESYQVHKHYNESFSAITNVDLDVKRLEYISGIDDENNSDHIKVFISNISDQEYLFATPGGPRTGIFDVYTNNNPKRIYGNIFDSVLVSTGVCKDANIKEAKGVYGGDVLLSRLTHRLVYLADSSAAGAPTGTNNSSIIHRELHSMVLESIFNYELRHEGAEDYQKIYPQSSFDDVMDAPPGKGSYINDDLGKSYDITFSKINNIASPFIDDKEYDNIFNNRVAISDVNSSESTRLGWRIFRPSNYYDVGFNRGKNIKLISADKALYIQNEFGLFVAQIKDVLQLADSSQAWLGTGDLFDRPPKEMMYDASGGIGCKDYDACIITKMGYIVYDRDKDSIYVVGEQVRDISREGFKKWLTTNKATDKQPLLIELDDDRDRLLISKKDAFTVSYSFLVNGLVSFHLYPFEDIISNREGTKLINKNKVCTFINYPTSLPSFVDINFIPEPDKLKLFQSILWNSEYSIDGKIDYSKTIDKLMVYNDTQCTGLLSVNNSTAWYDKKSGSYTADNWIFNHLFDAIIDDKEPFLTKGQPNSNVMMDKKDWYDLSQFISKYITIRLHSSNDNNQRIKLLSLSVAAQLHNR